MYEMNELLSHKILEYKLFGNNLLYIKTLNDDIINMYVCNTIGSSFEDFLIKVKRVFNYPVEEEGKYIVDVFKPMFVIYEIKQNKGEITDIMVKAAYNINKDEMVDSHLLPKTFTKKVNSFQKKLGEMPTNI